MNLQAEDGLFIPKPRPFNAPDADNHAVGRAEDREPFDCLKPAMRGPGGFRENSNLDVAALYAMPEKPVKQRAVAVLKRQLR
jgi:hypothetical protein